MKHDYSRPAVRGMSAAIAVLAGITGGRIYHDIQTEPELICTVFTGIIIAIGVYCSLSRYGAIVAYRNSHHAHGGGGDYVEDRPSTRAA